MFYPPADSIGCGYQFPRGPMLPRPPPPQQGGIPDPYRTALPRRPQPAAAGVLPPPPHGVIPGAPGLLPMVHLTTVVFVEVRVALSRYLHGWPDLKMHIVQD